MEGQNKMKYFPLLSERTGSILFASITTSLAMGMGAIAGLSPFMSTYTPSSNFGNFLLHVFDPLAIQGLAFLHCWAVLLVWNRRTNSSGGSVWKSAAALLVILFVVLSAYYVLNDLVYKPSFDRPRPPEELQLKIGIISEHVSPTSVGGAPSGFASRGVMLLLVAGLAVLDLPRDRRASLPGVFRFPFVISVQSILLAATVISRVLTGFHFWFDVLLGISLGTLSFWGLSVLATLFVNRKRLDHSDTLTALAVSVIIGFVIIGFFYSRDASRWSPTILSIVLLFLGTHFVGGRRTNESPSDSINIVSEP